MKNNGQIEILLLLCCAVGVVAFMSFAMGALNLIVKVEGILPDQSKMNEQKISLISRKNILIEDVLTLEKEIYKLKSKIETFSSKSSYSDKSENYSDEINLKKVLKMLQEELERIIKNINQTEKDIKQIRQINPSREMDDKKEAELRKLIRQLEDELRDLKKKIREKEAELSKLPRSGSNSWEKEIDNLKKEIEKTDKILEGLAKRRIKEDIFNPWKDLSGDLHIQNPLFVECKEDLIVIHPEKEVIAVSNLEKKNPFLNLSRKWDGIVFLIRPIGFKSFNECFLLAKKTKLPITYEPIDTSMSLDFSKE